MDKIHIIIIFTVLYIFGIIASVNNLFLQAAIFFIVALTFLCLKFKLKTRFAFIAYLFFILGFFNANFQITQSDNLSLLENKKVTLQGTIATIPTNNLFNKTSFYVNVTDAQETDKQKIYQNINSKIYLTINSDTDISNNFEIGDKVEFTGKVKKPYKIGNPNQFDYAKFLKYKHTFTIMYVKNADCKVIAPPDTFKWQTLKKLNQIRHKIIKQQAKYIHSPNIEILGGIVFGDDAINPPQDIKKSFVASGILHILAASGMNVAFIFSMLICVLGFFKLPYKTNAIIGSVAILVYAAMTGFPPSIIRAVIMLEFVILGTLINRKAQSVSLLAFAALSMLLFEPAMLFNISFQLSFVVTLGIVLFTPIIYKALNNLGGHYNKLSFLFVPIIAQIFVIPLQMYYFQTFSTYSLLVNILILPFLTVISFLGFICSVLNLIPFVADFSTHIFSFVLNPSITALIWISKFFSGMNNALLDTYKMQIPQIIMYYATVLYLYFILKNDPKNIKKYTIFVVCTLIVTLSFIRIPNKNFETVFFDVQNADCILLKSPKNEYFVIDSGKMGYKTSYSQVNNILIPYLKEKRVRKINTFIITHFDSDHSGGAIDLMNNYKVEKVIIVPNITNDKLGNKIIDYMNKNKIKYSYVKNEQTFYEENGFKLTNYYFQSDSENESSIITLAENKDYRILFSADVTKYILRKLHLKNDIDTIKIGHHGAKNTIDKQLIKKFNIKNAIISVGESNNYNHPHISTIEELKAFHTNIYRTDLDNAVKIVVDEFNKPAIFLYNQEKENWQKDSF